MEDGLERAETTIHIFVNHGIEVNALGKVRRNYIT